MFCMEQENYIKPEVEIYEVEVEQGFQASGGNGGGGYSPVEDWLQ